MHHFSSEMMEGQFSALSSSFAVLLVFAFPLMAVHGFEHKGSCDKMLSDAGRWEVSWLGARTTLYAEMLPETCGSGRV